MVDKETFSPYHTKEHINYNYNHCVWLDKLIFTIFCDFFFRRHWTFLTRSMTSSSSWWDQNCIISIIDLKTVQTFTHQLYNWHRGYENHSNIHRSYNNILKWQFICRWITFCGIQRRVRDVSSEEVYSFIVYLLLAHQRSCDNHDAPLYIKAPTWTDCHSLHGTVSQQALQITTTWSAMQLSAT